MVKTAKRTGARGKNAGGKLKPRTRGARTRAGMRGGPAGDEAPAKLPMPYKPAYRFLEHTADIMIESTGPDFPSALVQAADAMFHVMGRARPKTAFRVDVHAANDEELVVYFLSQILSESEAREMVPARVDILRHETAVPHIQAKVWGEEKRPRDAIKAVTFHELKVECDLIKGCRIQVLLDV